MLRPALLRTGRARFRAPGSSKPLRLVGGQKCQFAVVAATNVYETGFVVGRLLFPSPPPGVSAVPLSISNGEMRRPGKTPGLA